MTLIVEPSLAQPPGVRGAPAEITARSAIIPHVLLLGGQDAPDTRQLLHRFGRHIDADWPRHQVSALAWPTPARSAALESASCQLLRVQADPRPERHAASGGWLPDGWDAALARGVTRAVAALDARMHVENGQPRGLLSRGVYTFTRFSVDALYGELGRELVELTVMALSEASYDVLLAHSFGGTLALRAAWELSTRGMSARPFEIMALGTSSGHAVVRSPLWKDIPRDAAGRICLPPCVRRYRHFHSRTDAFVAAPAPPTQFADVEQVEVRTRGFAQRGRGHALRDYLAAPEVKSAVRDALTRR